MQARMASTLSRLVERHRGQTIDDVLGARAAYEGFTAEEVRDGFARYDRPEARLRFVITPK